MGDMRIKPDPLAGVDLSSLDALKALGSEAELLKSRRSALESMKAEFAEPVYRRVDADYARQLQALDQKAEPLRQQARAAYAGLGSALREIAAAHDAVKLDRQEIDLRHRLGEFDDAERDRRAAAVDVALGESRALGERAQALKARFLEIFPTEAELESGPAAPVARPAPAPAMTPFERASAVVAESLRAVPPVVEPASTRILPVLDLPEPPRPPAPAKSPPPLAAATVASAATMFLRTARLVPQNAEAGRAAIPLPPRPVTLGNEAGAEIKVGGPGVDGRHAEISVNAKGYTLVDLGSRLGTLVNAEPIQERLLRHEDVIQIGAARYVFREG